MRFETITTDSRLVVEECCACGVAFALPESLQGQRRGDKGTFYCPNGHSQSYIGKPLEEQLREARQEAERTRLALQVERDQRQTAERELKRQQQRTKGGVCPCCNRSFTQLARHMKTQHPDFAS